MTYLLMYQICRKTRVRGSSRKSRQLQCLTDLRCGIPIGVAALRAVASNFFYSNVTSSLRCLRSGSALPLHVGPHAHFGDQVP